MLDRTLPRWGWNSFIASSVTFSHFVHPCAAVEAISAIHKTSVWIHFSFNIEAWEKKHRGCSLKNSRTTSLGLKGDLSEMYGDDLLNNSSKTTSVYGREYYRNLLHWRVHSKLRVSTINTLLSLCSPSSFILRSIWGPAFRSRNSIPCMWRCMASWMTS